MPEKYGDYAYFLKHKEYSQKATTKKGEEQVSNVYEIYCRHKHEMYGKYSSLEEAESMTDIVFDIEEVPFVSQRNLRKTIVDKIKMNDDHSMVAFTLDIGNTEKLTGGIKDMQTGEVLMNIKLEGIS